MDNIFFALSLIYSSCFLVLVCIMVPFPLEVIWYQFGRWNYWDAWINFQEFFYLTLRTRCCLILFLCHSSGSIFSSLLFNSGYIFIVPFFLSLFKFLYYLSLYSISLSLSRFSLLPFTWFCYFTTFTSFLSFFLCCSPFLSLFCILIVSFSLHYLVSTIYLTSLLSLSLSRTTLIKWGGTVTHIKPWSVFQLRPCLPDPHWPNWLGCRIHRLHLYKGVKLPHDIKQSDGKVPVMLEFWDMQSTPSLPSLSDPLWPGVVGPERVLCMSQIELLNWIVWNRTVYVYEMDLA